MPFVIKTTQAQEDLIDIWRYTYEKWGEAQADLYLDDLENALQLLAHEPLICRKREELTPPVRIHHTHKHLVIYIEIESGIRLIRVLHESCDYETHLEGTMQ